jgi:DNA-binding XRE family transcriptional regulator
MKRQWTIIIISIIILSASGCTKKKIENIQSDPEIDGYVPNINTAIKIAESIWLPIYGEEIYEYKPFIAYLKPGNIWRVKGTLHSEKGGTPIAEIQKSDCKVVLITFEK